MKQASESANVSVKETCEIMRAHGFKIGDNNLMAGIRQKAFPFAIGIEGKEWTYLISRHKLETFLADWCGVAKS